MAALRLTVNRYSIRVGRSKDVRGPFVDREGRHLTEGGGTIVYASNHGTVYAPGGLGILPEKKQESRPDILYFHYSKLDYCIQVERTHNRVVWLTWPRCSGLAHWL